MVARERPLKTYLGAWAGAFAGAATWAASTQINYALAPWACGNSAHPVAWIALALAAGAALGGFVSFAHLRGPSTLRFVAMVSLLLAALFTAVILLHAFAGFVFTGCER